MTNDYLYSVEGKQNLDGTIRIPSNDELLLQETIFHTANGYLGVRGNLEEGAPKSYKTIRGTYINGFYDFIDMKQAEALCGLTEEKQTMLNVTDMQNISLQVNDETFSLDAGTILEYKRMLDMKKGICERIIKWRSPSGKEVLIDVKRLASFTHLQLFVIDYNVTALNFTGNVTLLSSQDGNVMNFSDPDDPRVAGESERYLFAEVSGIDDSGIMYMASRTGRSELVVCNAVAHELFEDGKKIDSHKFMTVQKSDGCCAAKISHAISEGKTIRVVKYGVFMDSAHTFANDGRNPYDGRTFESTMKYFIEKTSEEIKAMMELSIDSIYREQEEYLESFWNTTALNIEGDDSLTLAVHYNQYQLLQSVGKDDHSNIAAKGLSGEGYEGHFFWDTEMYLQPFFTMTNPEIAKNLIAFRYRILDYARENAKILGHKKGVLYPWRTIMGKECSGYFPAGTAQYHINGDIVYSIAQYYLATKDIDFIADKGAEIVFECARLWMDVGHFYQDSFRINCVTGPDEYTCLVNNNYYTNASAQYTLHFAVMFYYLLKNAGMIDRIAAKIGLEESEIDEFERAEKAMYLPYDKELQINPQDDSFLAKPVWDIEGTPKDKFPLLLHYHPLCLYRYQVCKQADTVLAHFIFEDAQSIDTIRNSFLYYEKITTHDSSLSTCIFSIVASKLGLTDKAYAYLGDSAKLDLFNTHRNTKDGIHTANMGGTYMAVVHGFGGLRLKENGIYFAPSIPDEWESYDFTVQYEGSLIGIEVRKDAGSVKSTFTLKSGEPKRIIVYDKKYELTKESLTI